MEPTTTKQDPTEAEMAQLRQEVAQLRYALANRPQTDRVVGMIMLAASCSADTAWARLSSISQNTNRKVRDVAALIVAHVVADEGLPTDLGQALSDVLPPSDARRRRLRTRQVLSTRCAGTAIAQE